MYVGGIPDQMGALWPWTSAAYAALGESEIVPLLLLICWTMLAAAFGRHQFERNLRFDAAAAQSTPLTNGDSIAASFAERFFRMVDQAPDWQVDAWVTTYTAIADGSLDGVTDDVPRLTGHPARALADLLRPTG